jgi:uncharacterized membrane protein
VTAERYTPAIPRAETSTPPARSGEPPLWLLIALGVVYLVALTALLFAPGGTFLERLRALDGGICAQAGSHSFFPAGQQLPLCARNTGIYLGFASATTVLLASRRLRADSFPSAPIMLVLGGAVALMGVDGVNSLLLDLRLPHLYQPHNLLRLATGLGTGVAMAAFLIPVANGLLWREESEQSSFGRFGQLAVMAPVLLLAFLAVGSQSDFLLYPIAILSSAGLALALTLINLVVMLGITNRIGRFETWRQVLPLFTLALALAVGELMALFAFKTWALGQIATM